MPKDQFKTRLEIAKKKILKKNLQNKDENPSSIGTAFKLSTELVAAVAVGTIIGFAAINSYLLLHIFCRPDYICYSGNHSNKKKY